MKHPVRRFKSLAVAFKGIEPFVRNGHHLRTGRGFKKFGDMRSREILANWLLCVTVNHVGGAKLTLRSGTASGGDGVIYDTVTGHMFPTEHVMVPLASGEGADGETVILKAIANKCEKGGKAYASGKALVVFNESGTEPKTRPSSLLLKAALVGVAYYVGALVRFALKFPSHSPSALWHPNSILLAALRLLPTRQWWVALRAWDFFKQNRPTADVEALAFVARQGELKHRATRFIRIRP
jgi:hypothetical protein